MAKLFRVQGRTIYTKRVSVPSGVLTTDNAPALTSITGLSLVDSTGAAGTTHLQKTGWDGNCTITLPGQGTINAVPGGFNWYTGYNSSADMYIQVDGVTYSASYFKGGTSPVTALLAAGPHVIKYGGIFSAIAYPSRWLRPSISYYA